MEKRISNDKVIAALNQLIETSKDGERGTIVQRQYQGVIANHDRVRDLRNQFADSRSREIRSDV